MKLVMRFLVGTSLLHAMLLFGVALLPAEEPASAACAPNYTYAQHLVDEALAEHPGLTALVLHMTPPGSADNVVIASNIWLTGDKSDDDDVGVFTSGKTMTEMNKAGTKFEVQGVLTNVDGMPIGSAATVFPYHVGVDKAALVQQAAAIRAELSKRILDPQNIMEAYPFDPQIPSRTYAQKLVDQSLSANPDVLVLVIHAMPPNRKSNVILGSNIGRIGKKSDEEDTAASKTGEGLVKLGDSKTRYEVILPLKDSGGELIGSLTVALRADTNTTETKAKARAEKVRDALSSHISDRAALFDPVR
ncbi:MAG: hypothetical protein M3O31_02765 [Acidobacteriota bacterium]|nr:hypothetical protein [Acidobacteriota bacterium]